MPPDSSSSSPSSSSPISSSSSSSSVSKSDSPLPAAAAAAAADRDDDPFSFLLTNSGNSSEPAVMPSSSLSRSSSGPVSLELCQIRVGECLDLRSIGPVFLRTDQLGV